MPTYFVFPIYTAVLALMVVATVPKPSIRHKAVYAMVYGGVASVILFFLCSMIHAVQWTNMGPFGFGDVAFFPPLAWTMYFMIFFHLLPQRPLWIQLFVFSAAAYSTLFSNVLMNLGILQWNRGRIVLPFFVYLSWFEVATWLYRRVHSGEEQE